METTYNGRRFRSQLEAKWAIFFEKMDWEFDYEPALDLKGWIPDFILYAGKYIDSETGNITQHKILVEVKPYSTCGNFHSMKLKIDRAIQGTEWEYTEVLFLGSSIFKSEFIKGDDDITDKGIIGWFYQINHVQSYKNDMQISEYKRITSEAYPVALFPNTKTYHDLTDGDMFSRFHGYWDHNYGASYSFDWAHCLDYNELKIIWNDASNEVQWKKTQ